jgi:signal transduction histidine kinase
VRAGGRQTALRPTFRKGQLTETDCVSEPDHQQAAARNDETLREETRLLREEGAQLRKRLADLKAEMQTGREARAVTFQLVENAVAAWRSMKAQSDGRNRSEKALEAAAMGTFVWYVPEDRSECDARMLALFGLPPDGSLTLKTALETMIHEEDGPRYAAGVAHACDPDSRGELREDIRVKLPNGAQRWLAISGQTYFEGEPRRAVRMVGAALDITGRKRTEDFLRSSEARQAFLLRLSDALRPLGDPLEIQAAAARVLGEHLKVSRALYAEVEHGDDSDYFIISQDYTAPGVPSLVGRHRADSFGATLFNEMREGRTLAVNDVATEKGLTDEERQAYPALGIQAYVGVPLIKQGRHVAILGVLQTTARIWTAADLSLVEETAERTWAAVERAQAEAALREAKAAADLANRSKDRFLAVLSHELRTPLTPVTLIVGAMMEDKSLPAEARENLEMIKRNIDIETRLIDDLLDLTRLNSGKVSLKLQEVDVNEIVRQACGICESLAAERHISIETRLAADVCKFQADPLRLQQALWNILKNAIKFTMAHGRITITTSHLNGGGCEVRVQDNGIGMKPEMLHRIFDVFEQGDPAITRQFGGLGLGLAITKALVELHHGHVRAESEGPGHGTSFVMELPM